MSQPPGLGAIYAFHGRKYKDAHLRSRVPIFLPPCFAPLLRGEERVVKFDYEDAEDRAISPFVASLRAAMPRAKSLVINDTLLPAAR